MKKLVKSITILVCLILFSSCSVTNHKISENVCIIPNRNGSSFSVIVLEALVHYVDYKGDKNVVLSVKNMAGTFLGWVVGVGIFVEGGVEI